MKWCTGGGIVRNGGRSPQKRSARPRDTVKTAVGYNQKSYRFVESASG